MTEPIRNTQDGVTGTSPDPGISWCERWRKHKIALFASPRYESPERFWQKPENVRRYLSHIRGEFACRVAGQIAAMKVPAGSRVLDIGAGPGTLAVPLARAGCRVTAVEPSAVMQDAMQAYARDSGVRDITVLPRRWEDIRPGELSGPFDYVIASYSLTMPDIAGAVRAMDAACWGTVNLFWFLTPSAWMRVKMDLWPRLWGASFPGEPMGDCLWQALHETGIHANIVVEKKDPPLWFNSPEEAEEEFLYRLSAATPEHIRVIRDYLKQNLRPCGNGYLFNSQTRSARIWWQTDKKKKGSGNA